jgi:hypothetical protein
LWRFSAFFWSINTNNAVYDAKMRLAATGRPRRRAAEQGDEVATLHSITSSARASTVAGISE